MDIALTEDTEQEETPQPPRRPAVADAPSKRSEGWPHRESSSGPAIEPSVEASAGEWRDRHEPAPFPKARGGARTQPRRTDGMMSRSSVCFAHSLTERGRSGYVPQPSATPDTDADGKPHRGWGLARERPLEGSRS